MAVKEGQRFLAGEGAVPGIPADTVVEVVALAEDGRVIFQMLAPTMTYDDQAGTLGEQPQPRLFSAEGAEFDGNFTKTRKALKPTDPDDPAVAE